MTKQAIAVLVVVLTTLGTVAGAAGGATALAADVAGEQPTRGTGGAQDQAASTEIASCTTISEPGTYVLADDIENSSADACIRIRASDVVLDGDGHVVDGVTDVDPDRLSEQFLSGRGNPLREQTPVGVAVGADRPLSNVTVRDLRVTDWRWGVLAENLRRGGVVGVRASDNAFGIGAVGSRNVAVLDSVASDNAGIGVAMLGVRNGRVTNVTASNDGLIGVFYSQGASARISNVTARNDDFAGVLVDGTSRSTVVGVTASGARFGVYLFGTTGTEVSGVTATDNRFVGIYAADATGTTVTDSAATNNSLSGVLLGGTTDATVSGVNASRNRYGVYLFEARDARVNGSTANRGVMGVFVRNTTDAAVLDNTVLNNSFHGVFTENSTGIRVENNRDGMLTFASTGNETIGEEGGVSHDETIDVNQSDGLSEEELRAYVYRTIARAEYLRQLEFVGEVSFEVISQEELERRSRAEPADSPRTAAWKNQLWEATFVVGEDRNATAVVGNESSRVAGFYNSFADRMVIVSDQRPLTVSSTTLVHEFVHALQDQHFDLTRPEIRSPTEDASRAESGLIEGDARYVEERFEQLCGVVWNCVQVESEEPPGGEIRESRNFAVRQMILAPYSDGPNYVAQLREQGDWEAVNDVFENPPNTTEQLIHPDKRDEPPVPLSFEDTARAGWEPYDQSNLSFEGVNGTTTVGEVGIFTMFWYQGYEYGNSIIDVREHLYPNNPTFDLFNYTSEPSEGWGNDLLVPYRKDVVGDTEHGYVWLTAWDTRKDAREFHRAYLELLEGQGARQVGPNTWVVDDGPFADAFRVVRDGQNVTIVNAPTVDALTDIRPGLTDASGQDATENGTETTGTGSESA